MSLLLHCIVGHVFVFACAAGKGSGGSANVFPAAPLGQQHVPAIHTHQQLQFAPEFCRRHLELLKVFRRLIARSDSKWVEKANGGKSCTVISGLQECQAFLRRGRQLPRAAGVHASFVTGPPGAQPLTRFGRPVRAASLGQRPTPEQSAVVLRRPRWGRGMH